MKWPWRRHLNGEAEQATAEADEQLRLAEARGRDVDRSVRRAQEQVRRTDWLAREIQRSLRPR